MIATVSAAELADMLSRKLTKPSGILAKGRAWLEQERVAA